MPNDLEATLAGSASPKGRYSLRGRIGTGASAEVFALQDRLLRRTLALKWMRAEHAQRRSASFLREARLLASLDHPAIPAVYDYGVDGSGRPYLVMQRLPGTHMGRRLRAEGPIRSGPALVVILEQLAHIAGALSHAHDMGYLHLDLKPGNLVTGPSNKLWLVDWGNALPRRHWNRPLSRPIGTLAYMSPEQARGGPFDVRTDVYGLGACLFAILTGHAPHDGKTSNECLEHLQGNGAPRPLAPATAARIPDALLSLAQRCLAPHPDNRPQTMDELRTQLDICRRESDLLPRHFAAAGTLIAREGEPGSHAWYLIRGSIRVVQAGRGTVRMVGPGEVLGELAPLTGTNQTSTFVANEDCVLAIISADFLREPSAMGPGIFQAIATRLLHSATPGTT